MPYNHKIATMLLALGVLNGVPALADEPAKPAAPALGDVLEASGITVNGYVEASYQYLSGEGYFESGVPDRVFDARHDSFTLNQAAITIAKQPKEGFGVLVNLTAGQDAEVIKSYPNQGGSNFDVTQAFVQYATGPFTIIGGKFVTLAGAETINPTTDSNFTRSILFGFAIPFTHTGLRATWAVNDLLALTLGVNNGWDQISDANKNKTLEYGVTLTPVKSFTLVVDGYVGNEPLGIVNNTATAAGGQRLLVDVVATWAVTDKFTIVGNYDYGYQKDDTATLGLDKYKWDGAALYFNYAIADQWAASLRGEILDDKNGYRTGVVDANGNGQKWKEVTLTLAYLPTKNFQLRLEGRYDKSDISDAFVKNFNATTETTETSDDQASIALEAMYKF